MIYLAAILSLGIPYFLGKFLRNILSFSIQFFQTSVTDYESFFSNHYLIQKIAIALTFILLVDFFNYWQHYLMHKNDWLWQIHKIHHSAESFNVFTALREHPLETAFNYIPLSICIGLFGYPIQDILFNNFFVACLILYQSIGFIKHSNINSSWSWFGKYIIQSPLHHRAHHATKVEYYDSNFGSNFQVWDHIFKTYKEPISKEINLRTELGIEEEPNSPVLNSNSSFLSTLIYPYLSWKNMLKTKL